MFAQQRYAFFRGAMGAQWGLAPLRPLPYRLGKLKACVKKTEPTTENGDGGSGGQVFDSFIERSITCPPDSHSSKCTGIAVSGNTNLTLKNTAAKTGNEFGSTQMNQILFADAVTIGSDNIKSDINSTLEVFRVNKIIKTDFSFAYDLTSQTVTISKN